MRLTLKLKDSGLIIISAINKENQTIDFFLPLTCDKQAAQAFFEKVIKKAVEN